MNNKINSRKFYSLVIVVFVFAVMVLTIFGARHSSANDPKVTLADPKLTEYWEPVPKPVAPYPVPSDAIVLFDGSDLSKWKHWTGEPASWTIKEGAMTVTPGSKGLQTKRKFCDMQLHIEWKSPIPLEKKEGQKWGNSGVYIQNRYEIQILNSHNNPTYVNGQAASIYKQSPPLVNASVPVGEWQTYDIIYTAPTFTSEGELSTPAIITLLHNGVLVQNHFKLKGPTVYRGEPKYGEAHGCESFYLQDHGDKVSFRNIWVREL